MYINIKIIYITLYLTYIEITVHLTYIEITVQYIVTILYIVVTL